MMVLTQNMSVDVCQELVPSQVISRASCDVSYNYSSIIFMKRVRRNVGVSAHVVDSAPRSRNEKMKPGTYFKSSSLLESKSSNIQPWLPLPASLWDRSLIFFDQSKSKLTITNIPKLCRR